jgi:hypothetical protein
MTYQCSCGFSSTTLEWFEDHLFTFPEDDHYELAPSHGPLEYLQLTGESSALRKAWKR